MTDPDMAVSTDSGRFYRRLGSQKMVPSITTINGMAAKPGIAYWGYKQCGLFVAENLDAINLLAGNPAAIVDLVKQAPKRSMESSANRGDLIHGWIERRIKSAGKEPTTAEIEDTKDSTARKMWAQFLEIEEAYNIEWDVSEVTVWSDKYDYAGTIDFMAKVNGAILLGDTKTGKNVYDEVALQLAAAVNADYAFDSHGNKFQLPEPERFAALHIRPTFGKLVPVDLEKAFQAFLGLRDFFEWKTTMADERRVLKYTPKIEAR